MKDQILERIQDIYDDVTYYVKKYIWNPILYRTTRRYHILDLRDGGNGYGLGWHDTDTRMLQANFLLLKEYVEGEEPFKIVNWDYNEEMRQIASEIRFLYDWWVKGRAEKHAALSKEWENVERAELVALEGGGYTFNISDKARELHAVHDRLEEEDEENLMRLFKIRRYLWT